MSRCKPALAAAAAVAALGAVLFTAAPADAAVCRARLSGTGTGQGILGIGTQNARAAATADFEAKAAKRHGKRFSSLAKASGVKWDCRSGALQAKCVVVAKPCR